MSATGAIGETLRRAALVGLSAMSLAGCADLGRATKLAPAQVDPKSPVAEQVRAASRAKVAMPRFRDVPPLPTGVRSAKAFKVAVDADNAAGAKLNAYVAANPPTTATEPAQTEAFADSQRARIPADQRAAVPETVGSEEFAARLRALATPPPPPK